MSSSFMRHLQRVRINIDQNLGRAERSEVLNEEEQNLERRVELLKSICQNFHKKVLVFLRSQGQTTDVDKRLKKLPESGLSQCFAESSGQFGLDTGSGQVFHLLGDAEGALAAAVLRMEMEIETKVITPVRDMVEVDYPSIQKLKKQLNSRTLDMDSAKSRYAAAIKQAQSGVQAKVDEARTELEEACSKVESTKDQLATEMYSFVNKESDLTRCAQELAQIQAHYHHESHATLQSFIPLVQESIAFAIKKPLFGQSLQEHLDVEGREIAYILEECIAVLSLYAMEEEGLFRIAGSASKIKKLKAAFNSSSRPVITGDDETDVHVIACVLKLYLRELPEPLMYSHLYQEWIQTLQKSQEQRLPALREVINKMPKNYRQNLRLLIKFLAKLSEYSDVNKMTPSNISLVMAPNLLWATGETGANMLTTGLQSTIVELLIVNAEYFFPGSIDFTAGRTHAKTPDNNTEVNMSSTIGIGNTMGIGSSIGIGSITSGITGVTSPEIIHDNTASSASPGTLKKSGPKKPPAPLPPPEKSPSTETVPTHLTFGKSLSTGAGGTGSGGGGNNMRFSMPEAVPADGLTSPKPDRPASPSPRLERPKLPPPERPQIPPPEKPTDKPTILKDKPGSRTTIMQVAQPDKPITTAKPVLTTDTEKTGIKIYPSLVDFDKDPKPDSTPAYQTHTRQSSFGGMGARPPRPHPPVPPK